MKAKKRYDGNRVLTDGNETLARRVAADSLSDIRSVRREIHEPGCIKGLAGERIRASLAVRGPGVGDA